MLSVGDLWFIDLRDPFGNVNCEFTYAIIVAVLKWAFECDLRIVVADSCLLGFVNTGFCFLVHRSLSLILAGRFSKIPL